MFLYKGLLVLRVVENGMYALIWQECYVNVKYLYLKLVPIRHGRLSWEKAIGYIDKFIRRS